MPTETFWYLIREHGSWWWVSMILIVGHFFVPFFLLLPVKAKSNFKIVLPVCALAWLMHALDLSFNIFPARHPGGYPLKWIPAATRLPRVHGRISGVGVPEKIRQPSAVSAARPARARGDGHRP
jgi:hypothetical protein